MSSRASVLYRRASRELAVSLPERRYDVAGSLLARAVTNAERDGVPVSEAIVEVARAPGRCSALTPGPGLVRGPAARR